ncbi:hypothetical protein ACFQX6_15420 [Streptosporangium lutulentum]
MLDDRRLGELTLTDLAALPDDAVRLQEKLRTYWKASQDGDSYEEFLSRASALLELPVKPPVRAAALRLLAALPTTTVGGSATDPLGRSGIGVTFVKSEGFSAQFGADDEVAERYSTILDPQTGTILAHTSSAAESAEGIEKGTAMYYQAWAPEAAGQANAPSGHTAAAQ